MKLFPILATMFAHGFASGQLVIKYNKLFEGIDKGDFSLLDLIHHYSAGMKAVYTQDTIDSLMVIR